MAAMDPKSGFCSHTKTFHSLKPPFPLPPETSPLSVADFVFSHLAAVSPPPPPSTAALVDADTGRRLLYPDFLRRVEALAESLRVGLGLGLSSGEAVFVLSPNSLEVPILYLALLSLGVAVSPSNPASTASEVARQIELCRPVVAFATSDAAAKISPSSASLRRGVVLLDSPEFESMTTTTKVRRDSGRRAAVKQSETAAILYSSGTTGPFKGVELTHRNLISVIAGVLATGKSAASSQPPVWLCAVPYFHVYGFALVLRTVAQGQTLVMMGRGRRRFDAGRMARVVEELRISHVAVAPPVVVAVAKDPAVTKGRDLSSLQVIACGGAPLRKSVIELLRQRLPHVQLAQAYGLTESTGRVFGTVGLEESRVEGAVGRLISNFQAKIVDPQNPAVKLAPLELGELCLKGPFIMKGYVGDKEATSSILDSEGWLKTGDLCYIDNEGFLFVVDRLKELIKYKGYQVAPAELEVLLQAHPDVADAAVVPYPDEEAGQIPMAFVAKRNGSSVVSKSQIMDFVAKQVAPYKRIRRLEFIDAIPKNAQGKVLRRELIKKLAPPNPTSKL